MIPFPYFGCLGCGCEISLVNLVWHQCLPLCAPMFAAMRTKTSYVLAMATAAATAPSVPAAGSSSASAARCAQIGSTET